MAICKHCNSFYERYKCTSCNRIIEDECKPCHAELKHDDVTLAMEVPSRITFAGNSGHNHNDPTWDNIINTIEGGLA